MGAVCAHTYVHAKSHQSCHTLCNPMEYSLPSFCVHGVLQARILEWIAMPSTRGSSWPSLLFKLDPASLMSPALAGVFFTTSIIWEACYVCSILSSSLWSHGLQPTRLLCPWNFPGKNTRVGYHALLQGIFPTRDWILHLLHQQADSLPFEPPGKPKMN